jgi:hypothetical protein
MEETMEKLKTGVFKIIKVGLKDIFSNFLLFVCPILVGYAVIFFVDIIQNSYQNIYIEIFRSLVLAIIIITALTVYCLKYLKHTKVDFLLLLKLFIISIIYFIYSNIFIVLTIMNIKVSSTLIIILQYIGLSIFSLFTIYSILNNGFLGIKNSFSLLLDNILFFLKMYLIFYIFHLFVIIIGGVIFRGILQIEDSQEIIPYIGIFINSTFVFFIMVYVKENKSKEIDVEEN